MKILFVVNEVPYPPDNGVKIVSFNAMRLMKDAGHDVALAVLTEDTDNLEHRLSYFDDYCSTNNKFCMVLPQKNKVLLLLKSIFKRSIYPVERYNNNEFRAKLNSLVSDFKPDVIHFDIITMVQYFDVAGSDVAKIASINDSYSLTLQNLFSSNQLHGLSYFYRKFQLLLTKHYESTIYKNFDYVHLMTDIDANFINELNSNIRTFVIPNGVNKALFDLANSNIDNSHVVFVAKLVGENVASLEKFIEFSWPQVHEAFPELNLRIVGKLGEEAIRLKVLYDKSDGVEFVGYVENLEDAYSECGIAIVPINKNCGLINKAIEAMASGLVAVGFEKTFTSLSKAKKYTHFVTAKNYEDMGRVIIDLLGDHVLTKNIKLEAHQYALDNYSWDSRSNDYESMYKSAIKNRSYNVS
ncbi:MAG: glycosyltransferase family 4 protein [Methylococcales bacterium]